MDLFSQNTTRNLLPVDGEVYYYGSILSAAQIDFLSDYLIKEIAWQHDVVKLFGKTIITKRKVAWYAENEISYTYSNIEKTALPFTKELIELKKIVAKKTGEEYNACLLNYYHDADESMGWHSDDEKEIVKNSAIASISIGAARTFAFKHKENKKRIPLLLENGSLLVMKGETQTHWLHSLPKTKKVKTPRINLTFRKMQA